jgi:outer membrane protein assembly factor BamA
MLHFHLKRLLVFVFSIPCLLLQAQTDSTQNTFVYIDSILVEGNKKTKLPYILRELDFVKGDSLPINTLGKVLDRNRLRLMNRGLYLNIKINVQNWSPNNKITLHILVREAWYIFPFPIFELADRNYNVWWNEQNHSLKRTNYGIDLYHNNLTGRGDKARIGGQLGYAHKLEADYTLPGIDKKQKFGLDFNIFFKKQKELGYKTEKNKLVFKFDPNEYLARRFRIILSLTYRPALFTLHALSIERHKNKVSTLIATQFNSDFFLKSQLQQQHWSLVYNVEHDRRDIKPYPLHGWYGSLEFRQNGLLKNDNLNLFRIKGHVEKYLSFTPTFSLETALTGRFTATKNSIPYYNNQALGYEKDFVRGFEYYVIDGKDFALSKTSLHIQIHNRTYNFAKYVPFKALQKIPFRMYISANNDFGYVNEPTYFATNTLNNRLLWGTGLGLDFIIYYGRVIKLEWSRNYFGENGFFVHFKTAGQ